MVNDTDVFDFSTFPTLTTERLVLREPLLTDATDVLIDNKGEGVSLCFFCDDALKFYRDVRSRGIDASEPHVGNGMWATQVTDPDGYELAFQSPTDVAEDTKLSEEFGKLPYPEEKSGLTWE